MIIHLLACADAAIKARALHLLGLSLSTLEGQVGHVMPGLLDFCLSIISFVETS